jgi:hypothetical protein
LLLLLLLLLLLVLVLLLLLLLLLLLSLLLLLLLLFVSLLLSLCVVGCGGVGCCWVSARRVAQAQFCLSGLVLFPWCVCLLTCLHCVSSVLLWRLWCRNLKKKSPAALAVSRGPYPGMSASAAGNFFFKFQHQRRQSKTEETQCRQVSKHTHQGKVWYISCRSSISRRSFFFGPGR